MKKFVIGLLMLLILGIGLIYIVIPAKKNVVITRTVKATDEAIRRHFVSKDLWSKWLPAIKQQEQTYVFDNALLHIRKIFINGWQTTLQLDNDSIIGMLQFIQTDTAKNSIQLQWRSVVNNGSNPLKKIQSTFNIGKFERIINRLLDTAQTFFNSDKSIYGFDVNMERTKDFSLLVLKKRYNHEPNMNEAYQLIAEIRNYIKTKQATEKSPPMLNIYQDMPGVYEAMAAIPTTKNVDGNGTILFKELKEGNILVGTVTGGIETVKKAEKEFQQYVQDHKKTSPAIPYQSLVTDRLLEKDTNKWVTTLYFPIFY